MRVKNIFSEKFSTSMLIIDGEASEGETKNINGQNDLKWNDSFVLIFNFDKLIYYLVQISRKTSSLLC